jgi:hypothetical protein
MSNWALSLYAAIFYIESFIYFIVSNVLDYEYCYALYGLRLIVVSSCITATVYLYQGHNTLMFDFLSGSLTVVNIVIRMFTIIGFSYCVAAQDSINDSNKALSAMLSINVLITVAITTIFIVMTVYMCFECAGDYLKNEAKRQQEHKDKLAQLDKEKAELERQNKLYEAKMRDIAVNVAESISAIPNAHIVKTE